jgi:hydrogenase maturation protease
MRMGRIRVIGCGNPDAGDDAVGLIAVREARPRLERLPGVDVVETGPALDVVRLLEWVDAAVIVDAVWAAGGGRAPGEIIRVDVGNDGIPMGAGPASLSSHGFGLAEAVGLAAALGRAPRIVFLGVVAADVAMGRPLSPAVGVAVHELANRIFAEARELSESRELYGKEAPQARAVVSVTEARPSEPCAELVCLTPRGLAFRGGGQRAPEIRRGKKSGVTGSEFVDDEGLQGPGHVHFGKDRGVGAGRRRSEAAWR